MTRHDAETNGPLSYHRPLPEAEALFLSGRREHDEELVTAGRVFLEFSSPAALVGGWQRRVTR
jgi:hypothetical protein